MYRIAIGAPYMFCMSMYATRNPALRSARSSAGKAPKNSVRQIHGLEGRGVSGCTRMESRPSSSNLSQRHPSHGVGNGVTGTVARVDRDIFRLTILYGR